MQVPVNGHVVFMDTHSCACLMKQELNPDLYSLL